MPRGLPPVQDDDGQWAIPDPRERQRHLDRRPGRRALHLQAQLARIHVRAAVLHERSARLQHRNEPVSLQLGVADRVCTVGSAASRGSAATSSFNRPTAATTGGRSAPISRATTRRIKRRPGGPITHDVTGAEYTDTILDIEGSPVTTRRDLGRHRRRTTSS